MNNYSLQKTSLIFKYTKEIIIEVTMPIIEKRSNANLLEKNTNMENIIIIKNKIPKIDNEFLKMI
jgi:hypothetical protein